MSKTLEEYLRETLAEQAIDHKLRASLTEKDEVTFYIHADGLDSETQDYVVKGNRLLCVNE
jgi:hypothetical protein